MSPVSSLVPVSLTTSNADEYAEGEILIPKIDTHLIRYEHHLRVKENELRRMARNDLAREGKIATETEIRRWREKYDKNLQEAELANAARQAREQGEKRIEA